MRLASYLNMWTQDYTFARSGAHQGNTAVGRRKGKEGDVKTVYEQDVHVGKPLRIRPIVFFMDNFFLAMETEQVLSSASAACHRKRKMKLQLKIDSSEDSQMAL